MFSSPHSGSTVEGFFSNPVYGGNRDMMAWRKIGFPGAYASYYDIVDQHGITIDRAPVSLAEDVHGHVHVDRRCRLACRE
jgi:gluconate 2-dehydrogenase gamma chain